MQAGDFIIYTFEGDTANPSNTYAAEILSVDPTNAFFTCRQLESGMQYTFQFSNDTSGPWQGEDEQGGSYSIDTRYIYSVTATDPLPQEVALITFANGHYPCLVQSIDPTVDVVFYNPPYPKLSLNGLLITESDWDAHPVGDQIASIQRCVLVEPVANTTGVFNGGWWSLAQRHPAFPARIGGPIQPFAVVVHTTDMVPEAWQGLVHRWTTELGEGACAHFLIGRDATRGVVQLAPITNNANHAGDGGEPNPAKAHGWFVAAGQRWHPNSVSVGIELHCAGILHRISDEWRFVENNAAQGAAIPDDEVIQDSSRAGVAYHRVTEYQYEQLGLLLDGLETVLGTLPAGCVAQSVEQPPAWGRFESGRRVGHVSLHAYARSDPWPATCDWIRAQT